MEKIIFSEDPNLGQAVEAYEAFCSWSPTRPISSIAQVTSDVCGHKFSKICGFNFKSKLSVQYPIFQIVYCPKTRSNYVRNDRGLHGWYIWQHRSADDKMILSIHDLLAMYGFDISKFFQSDLFQKYIPLFRSQIVKSYQTQVVPYIEQLGDSEEAVLPGGMKASYSKKTAAFLAKCAFDSVQKIDDVLKTDWEKPDVKKAKVAYNADKTYSLNMRNTLNTYNGSGDHRGQKLRDSEEQKLDESSAEFKILPRMVSNNSQTISPKGLVELVDELKTQHIGAEFNNVIATDANRRKIYNVVGAYAIPYNGGLALVFDDGKKSQFNETSDEYPDYQINTINDLENYISMASQDYGLEDRENLVFRDKNGKELKIVDARVLNNGINFTLD